MLFPHWLGSEFTVFKRANFWHWHFAKWGVETIRHRDIHSAYHVGAINHIYLVYHECAGLKVIHRVDS